MVPRSMNDISGHLKSRIDWKATVVAYTSRGGRKMPELVRQQVIENRTQTYNMTETLGIDLNKTDGRR